MIRRFWRWLRCPHQHVRCTHGDEIIARGWRRKVCLDCGRSLRGDLPLFCSVTGEVHPNYRIPEEYR